jgi:endonuclease/exonuclease/phosphatase family metal-dependent hydrolase
LVVFVPFLATGAGTFRIATYNVEGYLDVATQTRNPKSAEAKKKVRESIRAMNPDVMALQEIGNPAALEELRVSLKLEGIDYPYWEHVGGHDTNIHVAILSKFPFAARRPHTNDTFLLSGRRYHSSRGFAEVDIQVSSNYSFTLISGHLKSKRPVGAGDESELRMEEAKLLRELIEQRFAAEPAVNLVVVGDFNDTKDSAPLKTIIGRGRRKLVDTRPAERNGDSCQPGKIRNVTWTHYFATEDSYSRIDYLLLSPGMAAEWLANETYVLALPDWGVASDHRPLTAAFIAAEQ